MIRFVCTNPLPLVKAANIIVETFTENGAIDAYASLTIVAMSSHIKLMACPNFTFIGTLDITIEVKATVRLQGVARLNAVWFRDAIRKFAESDDDVEAIEFEVAEGQIATRELSEWRGY